MGEHLIRSYAESPFFSPWKGKWVTFLEGLSGSPQPGACWTRVCLPGRLFQGKNTGAGSRFLLQRIFPTQESNLCLLCLLHCRLEGPRRHSLRADKSTLRKSVSQTCQRQISQVPVQGGPVPDSSLCFPSFSSPGP